MSDRNRTDTRRNEGKRGRDQGRDHARFGGENDRSRYGSDRSNDQDNGRRFKQDGDPSRQRYYNDQDQNTDDFSSSSYEGGGGSSPFRSENDSTRQFQSTVSPFRGGADNDRMASTSRGGGRHLGGQMSESIYGRDEPYQGNNFAGRSAGRGGSGYSDRSGSGFSGRGESDYAGRESETPDRGGVGYSDRSGFSGRSGGGFSGRGPKGYERSDDRIKEEICDCLAENDHIDASEIEVSVQKGEVTLSGTVSERRTKRHAEDIIEGIKGIKDVNNQIRVQSSTSSTSQSMSESGSKKGDQSELSNKSDQSEKTERAGTQASAKKNDGQPARH